MKNVAIYSRKSIFTGKGDSIENQIEMCKDYYIRMYGNDCTFLIYEDEGFSGGNINRPKFQEMINDIKLKKFESLICYRLDRISRNVADFSSTLELLQSNNIDFISIKEQFDTSTPMGRAMVYISSVFAQLERETIAERVRDNMIQLSKTGRWLGGQEPFGFKAERTSYIDENYNERSLMKLSPIKEELEIVNLIFKKYLETQSITQVTNWLQDNKYKGKNGGEWASKQVQKLLSSPLYVKSNNDTHNYLRTLGANVYGEANGHGYLSYNKTKKMTIDRDITEWIYSTGKHNGVIDADVWLSIQSILNKNKSKKIKRLGTGTSNTSLLAGILKCSKCGSNMIVKQGKYSKLDPSKRMDVYCCSAKDNSRGKKCDNKNVRVDRIDKIVIQELMTYNNEYLYEELERLLKESSAIDLNSNKLSKLKSELNEKESKISNLVKQLSSSPNEIVSSYIMQEITTLTEEINKLKNDISNTQENKEVHNLDVENLKVVIDMLNSFSMNFEITDDVIQKRLMIQTLLEEVIWNGDTQEIDVNIFGSKKK